MRDRSLRIAAALILPLAAVALAVPMAAQGSQRWQIVQTKDHV